MMDKCCNPGIGVLLHAYELKALKSEDIEKFELHLLDCDYCFNELSSFNDKAGILLNDAQIKKAVQLQAGFERETAAKKSILSFLWPSKAPFFFRPAIAYLVAVLAIVLVTLFSTHSDNGVIGSVQSIALMQTRSINDAVLNKGMSDNGIVNFILDNYSANQIVNIRIKDSKNNSIYVKENFTEIDRMGVGRLYLPLNKLDAGRYDLEVIIRTKQEPDIILNYTFMIE